MSLNDPMIFGGSDSKNLKPVPARFLLRDEVDCFPEGNLEYPPMPEEPEQPKPLEYGVDVEDVIKSLEKDRADLEALCFLPRETLLRRCLKVLMRLGRHATCRFDAQRQS